MDYVENYNIIIDEKGLGYINFKHKIYDEFIIEFDENHYNIKNKLKLIKDFKKII